MCWKTQSTLKCSEITGLLNGRGSRAPSGPSPDPKGGVGHTGPPSSLLCCPVGPHGTDLVTQLLGPSGVCGGWGTTAVSSVVVKMQKVAGGGGSVWSPAPDVSKCSVDANRSLRPTRTR